MLGFSRMNSKKILLVAADAVFVRAMSMKLRAEGYEVVTAEDGSEAVSAMREGKADLILLDILFPADVGHGGGVSWDGFLIVDWLKRMVGLTDTRVIFITAAPPAQYVERARKAGAVGLFQKTVDPLELLRVIHRFLDEPAVAS
jgi:CheY-like chemotaxis protein